MKKNFRDEDQFLTDIGIVAHDNKDFKNPLRTIEKMTNKRMKDLNYIPFNWKIQNKETHEAIKNNDLDSVFF